MTSRVPALLCPYIETQSTGALDVLTSVLGASSNWLVVRYIHAALETAASTRLDPHDDTIKKGLQQGDKPAVILVSWLRDYDFWKSEIKRTVGIDVARLQKEGHFCFVDGLTLLSQSAITPATSNQTLASAPTRTGSTASQSARVPSYTTTLTARTAASTSGKSDSQAGLTNPILACVFESITVAIKQCRSQNPTRSIRLVLDTPSILLHTTTPIVTSAALASFILTLRRLVTATVIALPADYPFLRAAMRLNDDARQSSPLELDTAALLVGLAHEARVVLSCRRLGTGWAKDVSGVLRATRGGCAHDWELDDDNEAIKEGEWLYHIAGDGGAKVWTRGGISD